MELAGLVGFEWRTYAADSVLRVSPMILGTSTELDRSRREDRRFLTPASATLRLVACLSIAARYDLVVNGSTIQNVYYDRNYTKHVVSIETIASW